LKYINLELLLFVPVFLSVPQKTSGSVLLCFIRRYISERKRAVVDNQNKCTSSLFNY